MKFLKYKPIRLGQFTAHQFTLFECKSLFSIIFYFFVGDGWQDRFHTHAFKAISIRLFGSYRERILHSDGTVSECNRDDKRIKLFGKSHSHMLGMSKRCLVALFSGPWDRTWQEIKDGRTRTLTWGRKSV